MVTVSTEIRPIMDTNYSPAYLLFLCGQCFNLILAENQRISIAFRFQRSKLLSKLFRFDHGAHIVAFLPQLIGLFNNRYKIVSLFVQKSQPFFVKLKLHILAVE